MHCFKSINHLIFKTRVVWRRVARFVLVQHTETGKSLPNGHKIFQIATTLYFPRPAKMYPMGVWVLKISHLATLAYRRGLWYWYHPRLRNYGLWDRNLPGYMIVVLKIRVELALFWGAYFLATLAFYVVTALIITQLSLRSPKTSTVSGKRLLHT
jgi:hypothetical protein